MSSGDRGLASCAEAAAGANRAKVRPAIRTLRIEVLLHLRG
jgi:hypothetical protein